MTIDQLLNRTTFLTAIKASGYCAGRPLTQRGLDWINGELSAIEAQLDEMQPESSICIGQMEEDMTGILPYPLMVNLFVPCGRFATLLGPDNTPVGFEVAL